MQVEVAYALANEQTIITVEVANIATIKDAILDSKILIQYPQIDINNDKVGIFGKVATLETKLREKDRVEIYRPLIADPKEMRKQRAAQGKEMRSKKNILRV